MLFPAPCVEMTNANLDFELVQVGTTARATIQLYNPGGAAAPWVLQERLESSFAASKLNLKFEPRYGSLEAGGVMEVTVFCSPQETGALRGIVVCEAQGGMVRNHPYQLCFLGLAHFDSCGMSSMGLSAQKCHITAQADVVEPRIRVEPPIFELGNVYEGILLARELRLINQTQLGTHWEWDPAIYGEGADALQLHFEPKAGFLQPFEVGRVLRMPWERAHPSSGNDKGMPGLRRRYGWMSPTIRSHPLKGLTSLPASRSRGHAAQWVSERQLMCLEWTSAWISSEVARSQVRPHVSPVITPWHPATSVACPNTVSRDDRTCKAIVVLSG